MRTTSRRRPQLPAAREEDGAAWRAAAPLAEMAPTPSPGPAAPAPPRPRAVDIRRAADGAAVREVLNRVRAQLHLASVPDTLLCRVGQRDHIAAFCDERIALRRGAGMYISGSPGLGKSLTARHVLATLRAKHGAATAAAGTGVVVRTAILNAFQLREPGALYRAALAELFGVDAEKGADVRALLRRRLVGESDAAAAGGSGGGGRRRARRRSARRGAKEAKAGGEEGATRWRCSSSMSSTSCWGRSAASSRRCCTRCLMGRAPQSRLVLIGVANALDLTERFSRLRAQRDALPPLLPAVRRRRARKHPPQRVGRRRRPPPPTAAAAAGAAAPAAARRRRPDGGDLLLPPRRRRVGRRAARSRWGAPRSTRR